MGLSAQSGIGKSSECQYRISGSAPQPGLRRHGEFTVIEDDTGNTSSTYTDNSVAAYTGHTCRVKARKPRGHSPQSSFRDVETLEAPTNCPASGAPVITVTAPFGETLTADTSGIPDTDGLTGFRYTYRWIRPINGTDTDIAGATNSTWNQVLYELYDSVAIPSIWSEIIGWRVLAYSNWTGLPGDFIHPRLLETVR